ncbi:MAG: glycoside hydrolase family 26 protein [Desulfovibrionaceae bacterium]
MSPRAWLPVLPVLVALAAVSACGRGATAPRSTPAFGVAVEGCPVTASAIESARASTGLPVRLVVFYLQWPGDPAAPCADQTAALAASLRAIRAAGAVPCLTWEPMSIGAGGAERAIPARRVLQGEYDAYVTACARILRDAGGPVLVRLGHEMNLERYHWGGPADDYGPESPARYRALYRHVAKLIRAQGAANVALVFCPNADSVPRAAWNRVEAYYPGPDCVDVLGMDGYNWGTTRTKADAGYDSAFRSFGDLFGPLRDDLRALAPDKPLMVFETASASAGGDKAAWAKAALETASAWGIAAVAWFEVDKELDWPLRRNVSADPAPALRPMVSDDPAWFRFPGEARP